MTSERVIVVLAGNTTTPLHQLLTGASFYAVSELQLQFSMWSVYTLRHDMC